MANNMRLFAAFAIGSEILGDAVRIKALQGQPAAQLTEEEKDILNIVSEVEDVVLPGNPENPVILEAAQIGIRLLTHGGTDTDQAVAHESADFLGTALAFMAKRNPKHAAVYQSIAADIAADVNNKWPTAAAPTPATPATPTPAPPGSAL